MTFKKIENERVNSSSQKLNFSSHTFNSISEYPTILNFRAASALSGSVRTIHVADPVLIVIA